VTDAEQAAPDLGWLGPGTPRVLAPILATVDLERALRSLNADPASASSASEDPLLGARVVLLPADPGPGLVALAEPSTEGRLAATLARHDEGLAGWYVEPGSSLEDVARRAHDAGLALSRAEIGPFGASVLVIRGGLSGPHLILARSAAVPSPE
jgi:hypothetical protein